MLLSTTYFGPVQWYSKLFHCAGLFVNIEAQESFVKQTYRNRCIIGTANGPQALSIPVTHGDSQLISDMLISEQGKWRHLHWQALQSAYGESAFFDYYEDDIRPFFIDCGPDSPVHLANLLDYTLASTRMMCRLLDIEVDIRLTDSYTPPSPSINDDNPMNDYRYSIRPKNAPIDPTFTPRPYYQVYRQRYGFIPNLSILDLLFNEGPAAVLYL